MFNLFHLIVLFALAFIDRVLFVSTLEFPVLYILYILIAFVPMLSLTVRRLHDTGKSGLMMLVGIIPFIGAIWLLILLVSEGEYGANQYGPDPKITGEIGGEDTLDGHLVD